MTKNEVPFLLKLSHELKTPIHGISGVSKYLEQNWEILDKETIKKSLSDIFDTSRDLVKLIDLLLDKPDNREKISFEFVEVDLIKEILASIKICNNICINQKSIEIDLQNSIKGDVKIFADPIWYRQLIINLLVNAINYSNGKKILVKIEMEKIDNIDHYVILVQDDGVGIPENELKNIFVPFNRGAENSIYTKGTGLGLSICREIVEAHDGMISASNNKKSGSTVKFTIPIKR